METAEIATSSEIIEKTRFDYIINEDIKEDCLVRNVN